MVRQTIGSALLSTAFFLSIAPAGAGESYDNCAGFITSLPATITTQGIWCLDRDLATSLASGNAITIATNNVTLDCNHFKLGNLGAGPGTRTRGVRADTRLNATVRNCNIRGFFYGIEFSQGGGHLVEDNRFDGNTTLGLFVGSAGSTVRNNLVFDTGGSTYSPNSAYGMFVEYGVDVIGNTVNGVAPIGANASAKGIYAYGNGDGSISGNRVRGVAPNGVGLAYGIHDFDSVGGVIRDNDVKGPGPGVAGGIGISCNSNAVTARNNVVSRFATGIASCLSSSNVVNPN